MPFTTCKLKNFKKRLAHVVICKLINRLCELFAKRVCVWFLFINNMLIKKMMNNKDWNKIKKCKKNRSVWERYWKGAELS